MPDSRITEQVVAKRHTRGPWKIGGPMLTPAGTVSIETPRGSAVAFVTMDDLDGSEANARLIKAAPVMYAALRMIADGQDDPAWMRVKAREALEAVRQ